MRVAGADESYERPQLLERCDEADLGDLGWGQCLEAPQLPAELLLPQRREAVEVLGVLTRDGRDEAVALRAKALGMAEVGRDARPARRVEPAAEQETRGAEASQRLGELLERQPLPVAQARHAREAQTEEAPRGGWRYAPESDQRVGRLGAELPELGLRPVLLRLAVALLAEARRHGAEVGVVGGEGQRLELLTAVAADADELP